MLIFSFPLSAHFKFKSYGHNSKSSHIFKGIVWLIAKMIGCGVISIFFEHMKPEDAIQVSSLVWSTFAEFEAPGYKQEGIDEFKQYILPENINSRCNCGNYFVICCKENDEIVGVLAMRENKHISLMFVKKEHQRKGFARKLFEFALESCCNSDSTLQAITVNSSRYAVEIYEKLGFIKIDSEQETHGIRFTPMKFIVRY